MLTRLKVSGFKNLVDVDVRFGPLTCIAGANAVGKSNLFDAIQFLSALADRPFLDAARIVRDEHGRSGDVRSLFHRHGDLIESEMAFHVEFLIPESGTDDMGQPAAATITFLSYDLRLAWRVDKSDQSGRIELLHEELTSFKKSEAPLRLLFKHNREWRNSVVKGIRRKGAPFISTYTEAESSGSNSSKKQIVRLHLDRGFGKPVPHVAATLPKTVLSSVFAAEYPTVLLARREMQSWRMLQLDPAAIRRPDEFLSPKRMDANGAHLTAALYRLSHTNQDSHDDSTDIVESVSSRTSSSVFSQLVNRLKQLVGDIEAAWIDRDERRELLTLFVRDRHGTPFPARSLSDGTLRFLALSVLELDTVGGGVICLEEPENGIHPDRIPAMLTVLKDIATDATFPVDGDNPLRQVIINTHSDAVVLQVPDDSLLLAESRQMVRDGQRFSRVVFSELDGGWRMCERTSKNKLLAYLQPVVVESPSDTAFPLKEPQRRVIDRPEIRQLMFPFSATEATE